jgi:hypothetical protein
LYAASGITAEAVEDDRRVVLEARGGVLQRQHRGQSLVTATIEFGHKRLPARVVVPGAVNEAGRFRGLPS